MRSRAQKCLILLLTVHLWQDIPFAEATLAGKWGNSQVLSSQDSSDSQKKHTYRHKSNITLLYFVQMLSIQAVSNENYCVCFFFAHLILAHLHGTSTSFLRLCV